MMCTYRVTLEIWREYRVTDIFQKVKMAADNSLRLLGHTSYLLKAFYWNFLCCLHPVCTSFTCVKPQKTLAFGKRENIANYKLPSLLLLLLLLSEKSKEIFSLISRPTLLQQHMREKHFDSKTFTFLSEDFHLVLDVMCSLHSFLIPSLSLSLSLITMQCDAMKLFLEN